MYSHASLNTFELEKLIRETSVVGCQPSLPEMHTKAKTSAFFITLLFFLVYKFNIFPYPNPLRYNIVKSFCLVVVSFPCQKYRSHERKNNRRNLVMPPDLGTSFVPMRNILFSARRIGHRTSLYLSKISRKILCCSGRDKQFFHLMIQVHVEELFATTFFNTKKFRMSNQGSFSSDFSFRFSPYFSLTLTTAGTKSTLEKVVVSFDRFTTILLNQKNGVR